MQPAGYCKDCARNANLLRVYGITLAQYNHMLEAQGGKCAICRRPPGQDGKGRRNLSVDHDHTTGQVRGLLCFHCNIVLGHVGESKETLLRFVMYVAVRCEDKNLNSEQVLKAGADLVGLPPGSLPRLVN